MSKYFEESEIAKSVELIAEGKVFECRIIYNNGYTKTGYFKGSDKLIEALRKTNLEDCNVYITLNELHDGLYSRKQRDILMDSKGKVIATSENDVLRFRWLLIDLDPKRPSGISSTDEEIVHAETVYKRVIDFMDGIGFKPPIISASGNGYHLLYRVDFEATDENKTMLANCMSAVNENCGDDIVKIDSVNFKKSQVCKLYGTLAQKGYNSKERPFRMSRILNYDEYKKGARNEIE